MASSAVYEAEFRRTSGTKLEAVRNIVEARSRCKVTPEETRALTGDELISQVQWSRIWVSELLKLYSLEPYGPAAVPFLYETRGVVQSVYYDPTSWEFALRMRFDPQGNEYLGAAEWCRDIGKYHQRAAENKGSSRQLWLASESFKEAVTLAGPRTSAGSLAAMEFIANERARGELTEFSNFLTAYERVLELTPSAGGMDRAIASSWNLVMESLYRADRTNLLRGWRDFRGNVDKENGVRQAARNQGIDWRTYPMKEVYRRVTGLSRRVTSRSVPESNFEIRQEEDYFKKTP